MADLKPIGSEKLQGQDKINRILQIARYNENIPNSINETSRVEFEKVLADGNNYEIVKEKSGYVIKKRVDESLEYIEPMKNRKFYGSYGAALKRLNLISAEVNRLTENEEEISMFNLGEQKKFTLKTPKPAPAPAPEALPTPPAAPAEPMAPEAGSMDAPLDDASLGEPTGDEDVNLDMDVDTPEGDMDIDMNDEEMPAEEGEEVTFKTIQKLTGKLGQKIRMMNDSMGMTSEDVKYVINSILSALDLSKLDEEDQEDIMSKFEEDQESDDMDYSEEGGDEDMDMDMDIDMDTEEPEGGEMGEGDVMGVYSNIKKQRKEENEGEDKYHSKVTSIMDEIFNESTVDKVLKSYYNLSESEQKTKKQTLTESKRKMLNSIKNLSETIEQELASEFIVTENSNYKLVGKTNKNNLVFEHNGEQIKVTPKGEVL